MQVTILQWNVWYKENVERVCGVLKKLDADIICLQELTNGYIKQSHESTWEYIAHMLGYEFRHHEIPIIKADDQWLQANAIFSRYPIKSKKSLWLHQPVNDKDPVDQCRGYMETGLNINGNLVTVGTTHMSFGIDPEKDGELEKLLSIVETHPEQFILAGDFNATPDSRRISQLAKRLNHVGPPFDQNTWTNKPFDFPDFNASTLDWRYDYIFATQDIKVLDASIVNTDVSDHLPVIARVELPGIG
ncbi:MAG TPA: endonuclease/exonuclease/phosphatase family protein [Patescibacteria group bacterium]|nr:endonuclease/exonuclease/phosphatase family protein [Patescibacteria group bacterium]